MINIVVADDEPIERAVVKKILEEGLEGEVQVFLAANGREAVEIYTREECSIALLDIAMPGMNGLEAAEKIRRIDERGVIVFLTAFDEFDYARKAIQIQALDYLLKPVADEELLTVIEEGIRIYESNALRHMPSYASESSFDREELAGLKQSQVKKQIVEYIEQNYMHDLSLTDVAGAMHYSDPYFCKIFKKIFNKSFIMYLTELRIDKSKQLLRDVTVNIKDISDKVGFQDSNYYAKVFKRMEGMTPSEYRIMRG